MTAYSSLTAAIVFASVLPAGPVLAQPSPTVPPTRPTATAPKVPSQPAAPKAPVESVAPKLPVESFEPKMPLDGLAPLEKWTIPSFDMTAVKESADMALAHAAMVADSMRFADHALLEDRGLFGLQGVGSARGIEDRDKAREEAARSRELDRENRTYEDAYRHLSESRWDRAVERFSDVVSMKGARTDAALYWKAYAQDRQGQRAEALTTINTLTRDFPNSRYLQQAKALEAEVRRNAGQPVRPQDQADEELKLMAIAALQHQAQDQAVPMLEKILTGTASPKLKERALFVLAQSNSSRSREVLKGVAKGNSTPELQSRAISYLGMHGGAESRAVLAEVYTASNDVNIKKRILRAFMTGGEKDRLLTAAQSEQNPELRAEAVRQLGVMGAHAELSQLYAREASVDIKKQIIQAMFVGGNSSRMMELAKGEQNPELRRAAIRNLGLMGSKGTGDALVEIYGTERNPEVKKAVIQALGLQNNATALVAIARKEEDMTLKRDIVQRLSHINSPVARDYMLEILSK